MKGVSAALAGLGQAGIAAMERDGSLVLQLDGEDITISLTEVEITAEDIPGWSVASRGSLTVALDITVNEELRQEGDAREFVNRVQNIRKDSSFELTDRISVTVQESPALKPSIIKFNDYICREILADNIDWAPQIQGGTEIDINDTLLKLAVIKKG
jgi:isoleucyl-tRNA synthetase